LDGTGHGQNIVDKLGSIVWWHMVKIMDGFQKRINNDNCFSHLTYILSMTSTIQTVVTRDMKVSPPPISNTKFDLTQLRDFINNLKLENLQKCEKVSPQFEISDKTLNPKKHEELKNDNDEEYDDIHFDFELFSVQPEKPLKLNDVDSVDVDFYFDRFDLVPQVEYFAPSENRGHENEDNSTLTNSSQFQSRPWYQNPQKYEEKSPIPSKLWAKSPIPIPWNPKKLDTTPKPWDQHPQKLKESIGMEKPWHQKPIIPHELGIEQLSDSPDNRLRRSERIASTKKHTITRKQ